MPIFRTSVLDLLVSVAFEADCEVSSILEEASQVVRANLLPHCRITKIDDLVVSDRIQLREILVNRNPDDIIGVEFLVGAPPPMDSSVSCNGVVSMMSFRDLIEGSSTTTAPVMHDCDSDDSGSQGLPVPSEGGPILNITGPETDDDSSVSSDMGFHASVQLASFSVMGNAASPASSCSIAREGHKDHAAMSVSIKTRLETAAKDTGVGGIVVCLCVDVNPIAEIEQLGKMKGIKLAVTDFGTKLRLRSTDEFAKLFKEAMRTGEWFVVLRATKSIAWLKLLEGFVKELRDHNFQDVHEASRIFICTEQHPHFPKGLLQQVALIRVSHSFNNSTLLHASLVSATSMGRTITASSITEPPARGRKVRISAAVDIVDIEPRDVTAAARPRRANQPIDVSGSVTLRFAFDGIDSDKFLAVTCAGQSDRFAVGSSLGNVYFFDDSGSSLLQVHAHDASIWDLSFCSKYRFATGCEDGSCSEWTFGDDDNATLVSRNDIGGDVYSVKYLNEADERSPLVTGGLPKRLFVKSAAGVTSYVPLSGNCQVLNAIPQQNLMICGGGDGVISIVDVGRSSVVLTCSDHSRKVPALAVHDENTFYSGGFDSTIKAWDLREGRAKASHTLKLQNFVTGLHADGYNLGACVGENLYLWDVRSLNQVLGGVPSGWKGLSRALRISAESRSIVTASPDCHVRFWTYV